MPAYRGFLLDIFAVLGAALEESPCRSQRVRFVVALAFEATVRPTFINVLKVRAVLPSEHRQVNGGAMP